MSVLAEFVVPAEEFVLPKALRSAPDARIEIKRVAGGTEYVTPYFWVAGTDLRAFDEALRGDDTIREIETIEEDDGGSEDGRFYRVAWETGVPDLVTAVSDARATILEAVSDGATAWEVKILFPDRDALSSFHDYCVDHGSSFTLDRVYQSENPQEQGQYGVTDDQREALEAAFHAGYYNVPRDHTLTELADQIGISRNALSARLRRGQRNLLANTIVHEE